MTLKYPTDRVNNFSDAIFAIAITLLILDVKVPSEDLIQEHGTIGAILSRQVPQIIGLIVSFFVTALFWKAHLSIIKEVTSYDEKLMWINIFLLFFIVIMPFSTAFYSRYFDRNESFFLYCLHLSSIGFLNFLMIAYVIKKENLHDRYGLSKLKWMKLRSLIVPFVFLLAIPISLLNPLLGRISFVLIFVFQSIGSRFFKEELGA
jgi:uncharacterized membrane protein